MLPNMRSRVPARRVADAMREQADRRVASASSSRKINHSTVTRPGGVRVVGDGSIESEAVDGPATRIASGVVQVREAPEGEWMPLEQHVLEQVPEGEGVVPVAPLSSPEITSTGGPGSVVLSWLRVADQGNAGVSYDVHDVTDNGDVADESTLIGSTDSTGWFISPANGTRRYRGWARSGELYAPEPSPVVEAGPDKDAADILIANEFYAQDGIHAGASGGAGLDFDTAVGFLQRGPDGEPVLAFPITGIGNFFKGDLTVDSARAQRFVFLGRENLVTRNGRVMLASSIEAPARPTPQAYYPRVERSGDISRFGARLQDAYWADRVGDLDYFWAMRGDQPIQFTVNRVTGETAVTYIRGKAFLGTSFAFIGNTLWYVDDWPGRQYLNWENLITGESGRFPRQVDGFAQGIFAEGGQLFFWRQTTRTSTFSEIGIWSINQTTGALTAVTTYSVRATGRTVSHVRRGRYGTATTRYVTVFGSGSQRNFVIQGDSRYSDPAGADAQFPMPVELLSDQYLLWAGPDTDAAAGFASTGGFFADSPLLVRYTLEMSGYVSPVEFFATWARGDARTYETEAGVPATVHVPYGSQVRVGVGEWPPISDPPAATDVNRVVVYYRSTTSPNWKRLPPHASRTTPVLVPRIERAFSSEQPPSASTFPADIGTPGVLASAVGGLALYGNGKAEVDRDPVDPPDIVNLRTLDARAAHVRLATSGGSRTSGTTAAAVSGLTRESGRNEAGVLFTSGEVVTILQSGLYLIDALISYAANANGNRALMVNDDNGDWTVITLITGFGSNSNVLTAVGARYLTAGTTLRLRTWQNSGSTLSLGTTAWSVTRLG